MLRQQGLQTVVVDLNRDTVQALTGQSRLAIYGDAYNIEVLSQALPHATHLVITLPHTGNRNPLIASAKMANPSIKVFVRPRYTAEQVDLMQVGTDGASFEEAEVAAALARMVLRERDADAETIRRETIRVRQLQGLAAVLTFAESNHAI